MASQARRNRWAVSFADLLLLLLGFFILLQASGHKRDGMLAQVRQQFGGRTASSVVEWRAAALFLPDEALLSSQGRAAIARATAGLRSGGGRIHISSQGTDPAQRRFAFARVRTLFDALRTGYPDIDTLSMGMSEDFEFAIAEGATLVRIGTALFGQRV